MKYCSTRDTSLSYSGAQVICEGLAPDGGLFLPEVCPVLSEEDWQLLAAADYPHRCAFILSRFLTDFAYDDLLAYAEAAYHSGSFPADTPCPVRFLGDNTYVLELFRGPTAAFKDMALQMLPRLLTGAMRLTGIREDVMILTATSGDTGSAAMTGFADVPGTKICVFYPEGGTSLLQRLQMTTRAGSNVLACAVKGNFDDAQNGVKALFSDEDLKKRMLDKGIVFSSANSINWGRLVTQIVYYISAYLDLCAAGRISFGDKIDVCVPTGNFGNILSARYAKEMGLPVGKLICASNKNNILHDFLLTGVYDKRRSFFRTTSPSMDILVSSNLERLLFLLSGRNADEVKAYMRALQEKGCYRVSDSILKALREEFFPCWTGEEETLRTISETKARYGYLADTHTAVGLHAAEQFKNASGAGSPVLCAATASPFKFPGTVLTALGETVPEDEFDMLVKLQRVSGEQAPDCLASLIRKAERFTGCVEKDSMIEAVEALV